MAEWFAAPVLKSGVGESPPWVRIPPHPTEQMYSAVTHRIPRQFRLIQKPQTIHYWHLRGRRITLQGRTLYIGDGINDAPAMMAATAGIALGVNSDITSEAAGAVILQSSLVSVDQLMHIGRRMRGIALVSAVGGMGLSLIGMAAASFGLITPIQGAIAQEVIDLLSILNSLRMILPTGSLTDFEAPPEGIKNFTGD